MKLNSLYSVKHKNVLREYLEDLRRLVRQPKVLNEAKITITIDDDDKKPGISNEAREVFIQQAKEIGKFDDTAWIKDLVNGMKQAGVQGFNHIAEDEKPVSNREIRRLIGLLVDLVSR